MRTDQTRRAFLMSTTAAAIGLAGCTGTGALGGGDGTDADQARTDSSESSTETTEQGTTNPDPESGTNTTAGDTGSGTEG